VVALLLFTVPALSVETLPSRFKQKPGADIQLVNASTIALKKLEEREVVVKFVVPADTRLLTISLSNNPGIEIQGTMREWQFEGLNIQPEISLLLKGTAVGTFPLMFAATSWRSGDASSPENLSSAEIRQQLPAMRRVLGVAINVKPLDASFYSSQKLDVNTSALKEAEGEAIKTLSGGEKVHWLPADETVLAYP